MDDATAREPGASHGVGSDGLFGAGAPSLASRLDSWLADARVERSADARSREHWLREAADADATFSGVLLDLAERGIALAVATLAGRRHRGVVRVIGADFVALRAAAGHEVLLATRAIASVRTADAAGTTSGERIVTTDLRLGDVLGELAVDRARVRVFVLDASEAVSGDLRSVGQDVVTVRTDGEARGIAYVRTEAVAEVVVG